MSTFADYNFAGFINSALKEIGFKDPTPVQKKVIPDINAGHDVIVQSQTGSGKTHAYLLPLINHLEKSDDLQIVITAPSRELSYQIKAAAEQIVQKAGYQIRVDLFVGGTDKNKQIERLEKHQPQIAIGTPGRILDLIKGHYLLVNTVQSFVIDEADMTLDMGFLDTVDKIASAMPEKLQIMVFSATIPPKLEPFLRKYMHEPKVERIEVPTVIAPTIDNWVLYTHGRERSEVLYQILTIGQPYLALIFANTKEKVDEVYDFLRGKGLNVSRIHGGLTPRERKRTMRQIENMEYQYVVASDLAARGIDIPGVSHVINYEIPTDDEFFVHRVGRTGRNGMHGLAITLCDPDEEPRIKELEHLGIKFKPKEIKHGDVVDTYMRDRRNSRSARNQKLDTKLVGYVKKEKRKRKPGYKKKIRQAIKNDRQQKRKIAERTERNRIKKMRRNNH